MYFIFLIFFKIIFLIIFIFDIFIIQIFLNNKNNTYYSIYSFLILINLFLYILFFKYIYIWFI